MPQFPPAAPDFDGDQNDLLPWMEANHRRFGPIYQSSAYCTHVYIVSEPHYVEHVLRRNWQNYCKGRAIKRIRLLLGRGLMVSEDELWKRQRRMIQPAFHERAIEKLTNTTTESNIALLRRWEQAATEAKAVNVTRDIREVILEIILKAIFGRDYSRMAPAYAILSEQSERSLQFAEVFRALGHLITDLAADRRQRDGTACDMLGVLLWARDRDSGKTMTDGQLMNEILTLVVAGHETTASSLNWMWYLLSRHPHVERRLFAEVTGGNLTYARQVIEETLRLYPPGWLMTRLALDDDRFGDYFVPAGTEVYISPYVIQRREDLWTDPDRFDPDRFGPLQSVNRPSLALLPFSAGPRNCIGEHLARLEMQIHLVAIAQKVRLEYTGREPVLEFGVNLRSKHDFIMLPTLIGTEEYAI